jgi:simple sugar transport system permease protein
VIERLLPVPVVTFLLIAAAIWLFLGFTRLGRLMYTIGSNARAVELVGTPVRGDIASGNNLLLDSVAAAPIGFAVLGAARPNAFGTAIGALFVGVLLKGMTMMNAPYYTQDFVKGAVLVAAFVFTFYLSSRRVGAGHG